MPTIKKIGFLVILAWLSLSPLNAESAPYAFSVSPLIGMLYGQGDEILYKYSGKNQYASELLWDLKPLVFLGFGLDFGPRSPYENKGFVANAEIKFGLPLRSGTMEDRDWMRSSYDYLTHYSRHDAYSIIPTVMTDLAAGYSWNINERFALSFYGEFSFMYLSWAAEDGYTQYPPSTYNSSTYPAWSANYPKVPVNGRCILYSQCWLILSPGLTLKAKINERFALEGSFGYSPLIYCLARDDHLQRENGGIVFWDVLFFGHYINAGASIIYSPRKNLELSLFAAYRYISGSRGNSYSKDNNSNILLQNAADGGAGHSALQLGLAARIRVSGLD